MWNDRRSDEKNDFNRQLDQQLYCKKADFIVKILLENRQLYCKDR